LRFSVSIHDVRDVGQVAIRTILMTGFVDFSKLDEKRRRRCGELLDDEVVEVNGEVEMDGQSEAKGMEGRGGGWLWPQARMRLAV
jgi:hypothetical protein